MIELKEDLSLHKLRMFNDRRCASAFPMHCDWTASDWATALAGEVGELCNLLKKRRRGMRVSGREMADEMADVLTYLDLLASHLGIDLAEATRQKFNEVSRRVGSDINL